MGIGICDWLVVLAWALIYILGSCMVYLVPACPRLLVFGSCMVLHSWAVAIGPSLLVLGSCIHGPCRLVLGSGSLALLACGSWLLVHGSWSLALGPGLLVLI